MAGEHRALAGEHRADVGEEMRGDRLTERVVEAVRQRMIEGNRLVIDRDIRVGDEVFHRPCEHARYDEACRVLVILHVILRRLSQDDVRLDFSDHRRGVGYRRSIVKDAEIIEERWMCDSTGKLCGSLCLLPSDGDGFLSGQRR